MRADILIVSDSDKHFSSAVEEYTKRLSQSVTLHTLKPVKHGATQQIITKETQLLREKIEQLTSKKDTTVVLLSHRGPSLLSHDFAKPHENGGSVLYVIGGAYGVDESVLEPVIKKKISFGKQTMPHGLVKLVLLEQIRRAHTILINKKYHY